MKDILKQSNKELIKNLRWDSVYGPKIQELEKEKCPAHIKVSYWRKWIKEEQDNICEAARAEYKRLVSGNGPAIKYTHIGF